MAKVILIASSAWNDHRVTVSEDDIEITILCKSHEAFEPFKDLKIGDEFEFPFEQNTSLDAEKISALQADNATLPETLEQVRATNDRLRQVNQELTVENEKLRTPQIVPNTITTQENTSGSVGG